MNEDILYPRRTYRDAGATSCAIAQMKPVSSRAIAVANFGFAFLRDEPPEARRQAELGLPRNVADHRGQRLLPIPVLAADAWNPVIRLRRFDEQPAGVRIARLRDGAAAHTRPAGIFRRHEPEILSSARADDRIVSGRTLQRIWALPVPAG